MFDARNSYVITAGDNKIVNVYEYLGKTNEGKVNRQTFADGGLELSWIGYDMETYEQVEVKDSILVAVSRRKECRRLHNRPEHFYNNILGTQQLHHNRHQHRKGKQG